MSGEGAEEQIANNFIQDRLCSLSEIDSRVVQLLESFSTLFETYSRKEKDAFVSDTNLIFDQMSKIAIDLRKEVKHMDDNIGVYNRNEDGIMILPINVDQKNAQLGQDKLKLEIKELAQLLKKEDQTMDVEVKEEIKEEIKEESGLKKEKEKEKEKEEEEEEVKSTEGEVKTEKTVTTEVKKEEEPNKDKEDVSMMDADHSKDSVSEEDFEMIE
ncbi:uncharacterized protein LODBEIA_P58140 [Lodderomyces beijingensis]|uniref:Mediator of RNA polymerase II transcription subunit 11 n=1 Tax=Lodderomyces beijingensis TaxID=1775926 RepID=A0ABP0ZTX9_9ASCO